MGDTSPKDEPVITDVVITDVVITDVVIADVAITDVVITDAGHLGGGRAVDDADGGAVVGVPVGDLAVRACGGSG